MYIAVDKYFRLLICCIRYLCFVILYVWRAGWNIRLFISAAVSDWVYKRMIYIKSLKYSLVDRIVLIEYDSLYFIKNFIIINVWKFNRFSTVYLEQWIIGFIEF